MYDTNIMIDFLRGKQEAEEIIGKSVDGKGIGLSAVSCYELLVGATKSEEEAVGSLFSRINVYSLDLKSARAAWQLYGEFRAKGSQLSIADMFILATAKANDESFVTQDEDFRGIYEKAIIIGKRR